PGRRHGRGVVPPDGAPTGGALLRGLVLLRPRHLEVGYAPEMGGSALHPAGSDDPVRAARLLCGRDPGRAHARREHGVDRLRERPTRPRRERRLTAPAGFALGFTTLEREVAVDRLPTRGAVPGWL